MTRPTRPAVADYGGWTSPITATVVAGESIRLAEPRFDSDRSLYWIETRPSEKGRNVLVRRTPDGKRHDVLPPPWSVRTAVHEYGGGAYAVDGGTVYFSDGETQAVYAAREGQEPVPLTGRSASRYADFAVDRHRSRLVAVREDHSGGNREPRQAIAALDLHRRNGSPRELVAGADFYSNPRISPDGRRACWIEWSHPLMPWDGTELWTGNVDGGGAVTGATLVAGGPGESIFQPEWSSDGSLLFVSDRTGYWNLYRHANGACTPLCGSAAEFGLPQWVFGRSTYGQAEDGSILAAYCEQGRWHLALIRPEADRRCFDVPYTQIEDVQVLGNQAVFRGASPDEAPTLLSLDLETGATERLRSSARVGERLRPYLGHPRSLWFRVGDGTQVHGYYYAPWNPDFEGPQDGKRPPLIVQLHGGPTAAASDALSLTAQFWTSRGFALLELNYGGSTGFGRRYRDRLTEQWGVVDVEDTVAAATRCVDLGLADPDRLIVRGGSAGGFTVLCCLAFSNTFSAGASYYGIGDLEGLAKDTHKFESRYLDGLVGPWPEYADRYAARSPLTAVDRLTAPTVFFQGVEDRVVPKEQTETMAGALRNRGVPVEVHLFEGESHGFRQAETIRKALEAELAFYSRNLPGGEPPRDPGGARHDP